VSTVPDTDDKQLIAAHLERYRKAVPGCTQEQVAARVGVSREYYNRWENAEVKPGVYYLKRLAHVFGCEWTDFYNPLDDDPE